MLVPWGPRCTGLDLPSQSPPQLFKALGLFCFPAAPELRSVQQLYSLPSQGDSKVALTEGEPGTGY